MSYKLFLKSVGAANVVNNKMVAFEDSGEDDSEDISITQATQTERNMVAEIKWKFGAMPRTSFVSELSTEFSVEDLSGFRRSLYDRRYLPRYSPRKAGDP